MHAVGDWRGKKNQEYSQFHLVSPRFDRRGPGMLKLLTPQVNTICICQSMQALACQRLFALQLLLEILFLLHICKDVTT